MKKLLLLSILMLTAFSIQAQLAAGDIAIIGINEDSGPTAGHDHSFSFITLNNIVAGQVIYFTEQGWNNNNAGTAQGFWMTNSEGHISWTAPGGGVSCGTIIKIHETGTDTMVIDGPGSVSGVLSGSGWNLSGGDQIIAYIAASARPAGVVPTFLTAAHMDDSQSVSIGYDPATGWSATGYTSSGTAASHLPPGLTDGTNAVSFHNPTSPAFYESDNAKYTGAMNTDINTLRAAINDRDNWTYHNTTPFNISPAGYSPSVDCTPLSTEEVTFENSISLFPNPNNNDALFIKSSFSINKVQLFTITGSEALSVILDQNQNTHKINLNGLKTGIYFVKIYNNTNGSTTKKLVIK